MGKSMAGHLMAAGHEVHVFTRTKAKADVLLQKGAVWHDDVAGAVRDARVVITMLGFPADVEEVYLGEGGIIASASEGAVLVDMTTSSPSLAVRIYDQARERGMASLDAPVSGGDVGAREARLSIMVGGDREAFDSVLPLLEVMGKNIVYQGKAGSGQHTKMANQIAIAAGMIGVCEAIAYARKAGLDADTVMKSIGSGAAASWSLSNLGARMIAGNFAPGFYVKHFIKDMTIAVESAGGMGLETPGLALAKQLYEKLAAQGGENDGTQALYKLFDS
jgi:3-hydroxyisobutyrate dehydrogenase